MPLEGVAIDSGVSDERGGVVLLFTSTSASAASAMSISDSAFALNAPFTSTGHAASRRHLERDRVFGVKPDRGGGAREAGVNGEARQGGDGAEDVRREARRCEALGKRRGHRGGSSGEGCLPRQTGLHRDHTRRRLTLETSEQFEAQAPRARQPCPVARRTLPVGCRWDTARGGAVSWLAKELSEELGA